MAESHDTVQNSTTGYEEGDVAPGARGLGKRGRGGMLGLGRKVGTGRPTAGRGRVQAKWNLSYLLPLHVWALSPKVN